VTGDPTQDTLRSRSWDVDGDSLEILLGLLGQRGQPVAAQQEALRAWLGSASARPAPQELLAAVRKFLEVPAA
jgi:hypothetical protein